MSGDNQYEPFWRVQYKLLLTALYQESNRFWTRFQVSLAVNGGLLLAFYTLVSLAKVSQGESISPMNFLSLVIISALGIVLSAIWRRLTVAGFKWQDYWTCRGIKLEEAHEKELETEIFKGLALYEKAWPIGKRAGYIPTVVLVGWSLLLISVIALNHNILAHFYDVLNPPHTLQYFGIFLSNDIIDHSVVQVSHQK